MTTLNTTKNLLASFLVTIAMMTGLSSAALAQDVGVIVGVRNDNADGTNGASISQKPSIQAGAIAKFPITEKIWIRSGLDFVPRAYTSSLNNVSTDFKFTYFEIPAGLLYKFSDYGGIFAGAAINMILSKECGASCDQASVSNTQTAFQVGGSFKIAPQFGFELYYETLTSKIANGIENPRSLVANAMITFD
jgi:hypothetical protein